MSAGPGCPGCGCRNPFHNAAYCQIPPLSDEFKKRPAHCPTLCCPIHHIRMDHASCRNRRQKSSCLCYECLLAEEQQTHLSDDFKTRPWNNTPIRKPTKSVTDLPLFLGETEKHEAEQEQSQKKLF